ncbi:MAG TPA: tRNA 2-thiouridine(34) synthase MnmA [Candidatus Azoamicus sp. OHIO2]
MKKKKILLSLSAGIDSTSTLLLLKKNNFYIEAVFIINWTSLHSCQNNKDLIHAKILCKKIKIKLNTINLTNHYWSMVFITFLKKLKNGLTPNPDITCNEKIKFQILLNYSKKTLNFNFIATGHYATIYKNKKSIELRQSVNLEKDQTYFLSKIKTKKLKAVLFPITNYQKTDIKLILRFLKFINANKKNSVGICFIGNNNFKNFIKIYLHKNYGIIKNSNNKKIGYHEGLHFYTLGQRKTFAGKKKIWYVYKKNIKTNVLYISTNKFIILNTHIIELCKTTCYLNNKEKVLCKVKLRHQSITLSCILYIKKNLIIIKKLFNMTASGQCISFYKNNTCIGYGIVK